MSWDTLLVLLFLLLPVFQAILTRGREGQEGAASPRLSPEEPPEPQRVERSPSAELPPPLTAAETPTDWLPEVVSMEPLEPRSIPTRPILEAEPDRELEHLRFHQKLAAGTPLRPTSAPAATLGLHGVDALRRAVLLAEVLGPPVALRPPGE